MRLALSLVLSAFVWVFAAQSAQSQTDVLTYHNDANRTGWNSTETVLTPLSVCCSSFGLIASVKLDDQVDTQPLVVTNQYIEGQGVHTVVYVATEGNTVYAIDALSGAILKTVNLGAPVPTPLGCTNNGPNVGINGTPTIDAYAQTIYLVAYTLVNRVPTYQLHALDLSTLKDKSGSPKNITASHTLADGSAYNFNATVQRQRPALLQANGNIYAGFGSFCDFSASKSRGWVLGWNQASLNPLAANELTDRKNTAPTPAFLSSIWMSGYGLAADSSGEIFFVTGNSDPKGNTYDGTTNIQESVVRMEGDLVKVKDLFTPSNVFPLDQGDIDYGSGGVMVLPDQPGPVPHLAVAAGKDGRMFILNRDNMGKFHNPDIPKNVGIDGCWCGPTYYVGSDGVGRVVSSGGWNMKIWKVNTAASPALQYESSSRGVFAGSQDPGFFTSASSNGTKQNTALIWVVERPSGSDHHIILDAIDGTYRSLGQPVGWSGVAGTWPYTLGNANIVPTVANGHVYVASYKQLAIFGLKSLQDEGISPPRVEEPIELAPPMPKPPGAQYWGTIKSVDGERVTITLRTGELLQVDLSEAMQEETTVVPVVGDNVVINGTVDENGVLQGRTMSRAKGPASWGADSRE